MPTFYQVMFTFLFGLAIVVDAVLCRLILILRACRIISSETQEYAAIVCTKLTWGAVIIACCWVRTTDATPGVWREFMNDMAEADRVAKAGGPRRPIFLMSNHVSYLDSVVVSCFVPLRVVARARYYMISKLRDMPLLGSIARASGHFPVYFKRAEEDGNFKLDQSRMVSVEASVDAHLATGGVLSLFPEGQLNRTGDVHTLQDFRYGTFKRALGCDAIVWNFVMFGNHSVWPAASALGGSPGRLGVALHRVTPAGSQAFVASLRAAAVEEGKGGTAARSVADKEDHVAFAEAARGVMQGQLDALRAVVEERARNSCCACACAPAVGGAALHRQTSSAAVAPEKTTAVAPPVQPVPDVAALSAVAVNPAAAIQQAAMAVQPTKAVPPVAAAAVAIPMPARSPQQPGSNLGAAPERAPTRLSPRLSPAPPGPAIGLKI